MQTALILKIDFPDTLSDQSKDRSPMCVHSKFASSLQDNILNDEADDNCDYDGDTAIQFDIIEPKSATEKDGESDLDADADHNNYEVDSEEARVNR